MFQQIYPIFIKPTKYQAFYWTRLQFGWSVPGESASSPNATFLKFRSLSSVSSLLFIVYLWWTISTIFCRYDKFYVNQDSMHVISMEFFFWGGVLILHNISQRIIKKSVRFFNFEINSFCDFYLTEDSSLSLDFFGSFQCMNSINYKTVYKQ